MSSKKFSILRRLPYLFFSWIGNSMEWGACSAEFQLIVRLFLFSFCPVQQRIALFLQIVVSFSLLKLWNFSQDSGFFLVMKTSLGGNLILAQIHWFFSLKKLHFHKKITHFGSKSLSLFLQKTEFWAKIELSFFGKTEFFIWLKKPGLIEANFVEQLLN